MPVGVPGSNRDDSRLRLRSGDPASAGAVLAPVMRDLEHVDARDRGRGEPVAQLFLLRVTGEKSTKLPVLNEDANGRVVGCGVFFLQAEDGIRDLYVTEFRRVLFRSRRAHERG